MSNQSYDDLEQKIQEIHDRIDLLIFRMTEQERLSVAITDAIIKLTNHAKINGELVDKILAISKSQNEHIKNTMKDNL